MNTTTKTFLAALALPLASGIYACSSDGGGNAVSPSAAPTTTPSSPDAAGQPSGDSGICPAPPKQYANQPAFTPPDTRVDDYLDVLPASLGPAIDAAKGYYTAEINGGVHWVTDGMYQSMFIVTSNGVVAVDAPQTIGANLTKAIAEVTSLPVTHLIYTHSHADHIGASTVFSDGIPIIAHDETKRLLTRSADPNRRIPTVTFSDTYTLTTGGQTIELSYPGTNHEPGNIIIHLPTQRVAMMVDIVFPGWMMWKRLGVAQDVPGLVPAIDALLAKDFDLVVTGHVGRLGTRADVEQQKQFLTDLKEAAAKGLGGVSKSEVAADMRPEDLANPWAFYRGFIDRAVNDCVSTMASKWQSKISGFDVWIYDQCATMEQSVRID